MQILYDFLPALCFFIGYKIFNIFVATTIAMGIAAIQITVHWIKYHSVDPLQILTALLIILFGGVTLLLQDPIFIQWKPTILGGILATIFLGSQVLGYQPFLQKIMGHKIKLPLTAWKTLNISWGIFWILLGATNLFIVYNFSMSTWVNFKLFGIFGSLMVFSILQSLYIYRVIEHPLGTGKGE